MKIYCAPRGGKDGSAVVYALLRHAFQAEYGGDLPEIKKTPNGKPYFPERPDIHFSLSHAKTHVLCAVSTSPVGVDIESPRTISKRAVNFFASPEELALFDPLDLWVLKESYIKLTDSTLMSMRGKLQFTRSGGKITAPDVTVESRLYRIEGCHAAVCTLGGEPAESIDLVPGSSDNF